MPEYVIRIEDKTSQTSAAPVASQAPPKEQQGQQKRNKQVNASAYITSQMIIPMAKNITTYVTTTVGIETGSQELQQKTDLVLSVASDAANTANTILAGSAAIGGVFGVAAGATVAAVNLAIKYSTKYAQMQQQMRLEEEQLALYRSRMGAGFNQSRNGGAR